MWGKRLRITAVPLAVLAGSQLGHAITYYARYGQGAGTIQSTGAHAYLPAVASVLSAGLGALVMLGLLMMAAARSFRPPPAGYQRRTTLRFTDLLPALFVAQLVVFAGQETIESMVAVGGDLPSPPELLLWGALGQLPAAAVAAGVLAWLLSRVEAAWTALLDGAAAQFLALPWAPAAAGPVRPAPASALRLASAFPSAFRKRGPPSLLEPLNVI